jgi:hypothetical protein
MPGRLSDIVRSTLALIAGATLRIATDGAGFTGITGDAADFVVEIAGGEGTLLVICVTPRPRSSSTRTPTPTCSAIS